MTKKKTKLVRHFLAYPSPEATSEELQEQVRLLILHFETMKVSMACDADDLRSARDGLLERVHESERQAERAELARLGAEVTIARLRAVVDAMMAFLPSGHGEDR
jgi:hypothetical protein